MYSEIIHASSVCNIWLWAIPEVKGDNFEMSIQRQLVTIPNTELHFVSSDIVGDQFKISVALPKNYADTTERYPVVYLLDANIFFGLVTETARLLQFGKEIPDCVIVGIGYPDDAQHLTLRNRDYIPPPDEAFLQDKSNDVPDPTMHKADKFLAFLCHELMPYLQDQYRIDPDDTVLAGDSNSGLFGLYTLFHQPTLFRRYIIGSPAMYCWNNVTFDYEARYAATHDDLPVTIFLSAGALEAIFEPAFAAMLSNVAKLTEILTSRKYPGLKLISHIFDNETHYSVIPATMSRGLRAVFE
jgi:predicted alpha/beta superfamily hydrolase